MVLAVCALRVKTQSWHSGLNREQVCLRQMYKKCRGAAALPLQLTAGRRKCLAGPGLTSTFQVAMVQVRSVLEETELGNSKRNIVPVKQ